MDVAAQGRRLTLWDCYLQARHDLGQGKLNPDWLDDALVNACLIDIQLEPLIMLIGEQEDRPFESCTQIGAHRNDFFVPCINVHHNKPAVLDHRRFVIDIFDSCGDAVYAALAESVRPCLRVPSGLADEKYLCV